MKIVYIVSTLRKCGPIFVLLNIVKYLSSDFKPFIITISKERNHTLIDEFKDKLSVPCNSLNLGKLGGVVSGQKKIKNLLDALKPELIHSHGYRADKLVSAFANNYRIISTLHCNPYKDYSVTYPYGIGHLMASQHLSALKKINEKVLVSKSLLKQLKNKIGNNVLAIANSVDTAKYFRINDNEKRLLRVKLGLAEHKKIFLYAGNFIGLKNPQLVIKAFKEIGNRDKLLIMLGDGKLFKPCKELIKNVDNINLLGRVSNVNEYLQASDFFISASTTEGLPVAVLEALACGLGVILSNIEPHAELIENNLKAGVLFDLKEPKLLIESIYKVLKKDYREMSNASLDIIDKNYSAPIMSHKYQKLYAGKNGLK